MDLLNGNLKKLYLKFLLTAFGSTLITCIYSFVDMAVVGQKVGPSGASALAIVAPVWNILYFASLLTGVGGSILFSNLKAKGNHDENTYFTSSFIFAGLLCLIEWILFLIFEKNILVFFGAQDEALLNLAMDYLKPIRFAFPLFLFNNYLSVFIRNDNNPILSTIGILGGGIFNVIGDISFVFGLNMGIFGAGLATALGAVVSFLILIIHFFTKKNTLRFVKTPKIFIQFKNIFLTGFSSGFVDVAMGILTIMFNNQILKYVGNDALSVYGPIINIFTFVQCTAYAVGQAAQPLLSSNFGGDKIDRVNKTLKYSLISVGILSLFWILLTTINPNMFIYLFMKPTDAILEIAPSIIRTYAVSFLLLPFNVFSTYYFQSILKPRYGILVSILRGLVISSILLYLLPLINPFMIWWVMPLTELLVAIIVLLLIIKCQRNINKNIENKELESN